MKNCISPLLVNITESSITKQWHEHGNLQIYIQKRKQNATLLFAMTNIDLGPL